MSKPKVFFNIDSHFFLFMLGLQLTKKNSAYLLQMLDHPLSFLSSAQLPLSKLNSFPLSFSLILPPSTFTARSLAISHLKDWWRLMKWLVWADFKPQATQSSCLTSSYKNILKSLMFLWGTGVPYCLGHNFTIVLSQSETILPPKEAITLSSISVSAPTISFQVAVWYSRLLFLFIFFLVAVGEEPDLIASQLRGHKCSCQKALGSIQLRKGKKCYHCFWYQHRLWLT